MPTSAPRPLTTSSTIPVARGTGSPNHAGNWRRRTREGPEPACVQTLFELGVAHAVEKGESTSCRGTVLSAW